MLTSKCDSYEEVCERFSWRLPRRYNIAAGVCDRHAELRPSAPALVHERADVRVHTYTFGQIQRYANPLANVFSAEGFERGDRIMLLLGQDPATAISHVAAWKAGMVTIPTSCLFGTDALEYRLSHSRARAVVTDSANYTKLLEIRERLPELRRIFLVDGPGVDAISLWDAMGQASDCFHTLAPPLDAPAFISYTSGTTGLPKGTVHGHRVMLGHMPAIEFMLDFFPQSGDLMWSPADRAWLAGLFVVLMPAWFAGIPVLTYRARSFDPEEALVKMGTYKVRTALLTPTMLKLFRQVSEPSGLGVELRSVLAGSEAVGRELLEWASSADVAPFFHPAMGRVLG